jgi:hypothetical protein
MSVWDIIVGGAKYGVIAGLAVGAIVGLIEGIRAGLQVGSRKRTKSQPPDEEAR